jgi:hypothetical protein
MMIAVSVDVRFRFFRPLSFLSANNSENFRRRKSRLSKQFGRAKWKNRDISCPV